MIKKGSIPDPAINIWEHSAQLLELCRLRASDQVEEMDCAAQGAELAISLGAGSKVKLLDAGCGGGHFYHSLIRRGAPIDYCGLDYSPSYLKVAELAFKKLGINCYCFFLADLAQLHDFDCQMAVMINVLSFNPDFRAPLERLILTGAEVIVIRDFFGPRTVVKWEIDGYLDEGFNHLKGYWNQWSKKEVAAFFSDFGFKTRFIEDRRCQGRIEKVVGKDYVWSWLTAEKK
ncbi:MAG: class I SAM-dependent methyltransferase [Deltaproteobacteria bacterium]|jgi:SAM-dependent methyltransferase|nr:class I SAM-dependent methyltransferase [Deltaproteobacteria bacterium]